MLFVDHKLIADQQDRQPGSLGLEENAGSLPYVSARKTRGPRLKRFWRDLGVRAKGDPAALTRLPAEIVEAVEAIWQRSLALSAQAAKHDDNAARERLEQIRIENDVRAQSFSLREKEFETAAGSARGRSRTRAITCSPLLGCWKVTVQRCARGKRASPRSKRRSRITAGSSRQSLRGLSPGTERWPRANRAPRGA
jgi:hypothetical protein